MKKMTDYDKGLKEATIELTSALKAVDGALERNGGRKNNTCTLGTCP